MSENLPLYEVTVSEFVGDGEALVDQTIVASCTMIEPSGALCVFGPNKQPVTMIAHGYWTSVRYRLIEKGEMQ